MAGFAAIIPPDTRRLYDDLLMSPGIRAGNLVIASGRIGYNADRTMPPDAETQIRNAFRYQEAVLRECGLDFGDVFLIDTYHVGPVSGQFAAYRKVAAEFVREPYPAWFCAEVASLLLPGAVFELRVMAMAGSSRGGEPPVRGGGLAGGA